MYLGNESLPLGANPFVPGPSPSPNEPNSNGAWIGILIVLVLLLISIIAFILFKLYSNKGDEQGMKTLVYNRIDSENTNPDADETMNINVGLNRTVISEDLP